MYLLLPATHHPTSYLNWMHNYYNAHATQLNALQLTAAEADENKG